MKLFHFLRNFSWSKKSAYNLVWKCSLPYTIYEQNGRASKDHYEMNMENNIHGDNLFMRIFHISPDRRLNKGMAILETKDVSRYSGPLSNQVRIFWNIKITS